MTIIIGLLVLIFLAIVAPRFLGLIIGLGVLFVLGAILTDGHPHPVLWWALGIFVVWQFIRGAIASRGKE